MKKFTGVSAKSMMCFALAGLLSVSGINKPAGKESVNEELSKNSIVSVHDEIQKSSFSTQEINEISQAALVNGEDTAKIINGYTNQVDYEAAVNYAMTAYYENESFDEMESFEAAIDDRSSEIIKGYKAAAVERATGDSNGYEAGTVLLTFDKETPKKDIKAVVEAEYGECRDIFECFNGDYLVTVDISLGQTVDMAEKAYKEYSITETASANDYERIADSAVGAVNDTYISEQYYLDNMNVKSAWDLVSQSEHEKVIVGVIDSGIQLNHPELDDVISPKSAAVTSSTGKPVLLSTLSSTYDTAHGTEVAGIIAAEANNSRQMAGVASCYNNDVVEILAVKVTQYYSTEDAYLMPVSFVIRAINYCVEQGAKVINYSGAGATRNETRYKTIRDANNAGVIFVCSAGNGMQDQPCYPSDLDNTISVVATNSKDELASFSCYGMAKDFAAPGESTLTTSIKDGTKFQSGTSFSSPAVAAVVAMMCSLDNTLNFESVYNILATTSVDIGLGNKCKYGLIDAYAAVKNVVEGEADVEATTELEIATDVEATTDVETLTVEAKTPETTVSETTILNPVPLEVIGALVSSPAENTVAVVWGQDTERIENKYKYNVYVNGEKKLSLVDCSYYIISDIEPGSVAVRITAVLNEAETAGVTQTVTVEGSELNPSEVTTEAATVVLETTTLEEITIEEVTTIAITEEATVKEDIIIEEATTTQEVINLSKGKATYASSVENDSLAAGFATDGDMSTRWSSAWSDMEWIYVDLGAEKFVSYVELDWEAAYATGYHFLISDDGEYWKVLKNITNGTGGKEKIYINDYARYVKLQCTDRSTEYGNSLYEMSVFGY